jgi:hypothetical protein
VISFRTTRRIDDHEIDLRPQQRDRFRHMLDTDVLVLADLGRRRKQRKVSSSGVVR